MLYVMFIYPAVDLWPIYKDLKKTNDVSLSTYVDEDDCNIPAFWPSYQV